MKITNQKQGAATAADLISAASLLLKFGYQVAIRKAKLDGAKVYTHYIEVIGDKEGSV